MYSTRFYAETSRLECGCSTRDAGTGGIWYICCERGARYSRSTEIATRLSTCGSCRPRLPLDFRAENFQVGSIERMPFSDGFADVVICNSVLHFARDDRHFQAMLRELWRVLRPGGMLFCRLGSRIGMDFRHVRGKSSWWATVQSGFWWTRRYSWVDGGDERRAC